MKVFFNALVIHLIFNVYVFIRGWQLLPSRKSYKIPYTALFIIELTTYFIGFIFWSELPVDILNRITFIGTSWMILIGYFTVFLLAYDLLLFLYKKRKKYQSERLSRISWRRTYFIGSLLFVIALMGYGRYCFRNSEVIHLDIQLDKERKGDLDSIKMVMVADIHVGALIDKEILQMYVKRIMELQPDIIVIPGDIIDYDLPSVVKQRMDEEFRMLHAPYGVYASTGNHEYRLNAEDKIKWLSEDAGLTMLRDSVVKIADSFYLVGREDDLYPERKPLESLMTKVDRKYPVIVLNHEPKRLGEESYEQVDLALYGHTHDGQLFPYNIILNWIYEVSYGYKKKDNTHIYVTSGLGLSGPQYRIGTKSEIVEINLKF